jgi:heptosyltransferase-3
MITGLRRAYPDAEIHVLVRRGVQHVFDGNPDIDHLLTMTRRPPLSEGIPFVRAIYRKYDIAVSSSYVDRAILHCVAAAPRRASLIPAVNSAFGQNRWWKKRLVQHWESFDEGKHFLQQSAELLAQSGIPCEADGAARRRVGKDGNRGVSDLRGARKQALDVVGLGRRREALL